jgi:hypothetical protein
MKARNLDEVVTNLRIAGARCVVVPGVVDPARGVDADLIPHAVLTLCRLRAEPGDLRERIAVRGRPTDEVDEVLRAADAFDRNDLPGVRVDTSGRSVAEVVRLVQEQSGGWPGLGERAKTLVVDGSYDDPVVPTAGEVLLLCGPTAVGKSTVGWHIYEQIRYSGQHAAFVDLQQIGFYRPVPGGDPGNHRLKASNLAAMWRTYRASGAQRLIVVGRIDYADAVRMYAAALPAATFSSCRLHASRGQLAKRIDLRSEGVGAPRGLAGDELIGQPAVRLGHFLDQAATEAKMLEHAAIGDLRIDTDDRAVQDIAQEILGRTGWAKR